MAFSLGFMSKTTLKSDIMQWSYFEAVLMMMYKKDFNRAQRLSC